MFINKSMECFNLLLNKNPTFTTKQKNYRTTKRIIALIKEKPFNGATHFIFHHSYLYLPSEAALANIADAVSEAVNNKDTFVDERATFKF